MCLGQRAASCRSEVLVHLSGIVPSRSKSVKEEEKTAENRNQLKLEDGDKFEWTNYTKVSEGLSFALSILTEAQSAQGIQSKFRNRNLPEPVL